MSEYKYLIISDLHLGSAVCQSDKILQVLKEENYDVLIINGDLIDSLSLHRLDKNQWKVLSELRKISKNKTCLFITGNHDASAEIIGALLGFEFLEEFVFISGGQKILVTHGHLFDEYIKNKPVLTDIVSGIYYHFQKLSNQKFTKWIKHKSKEWIGAAKNVRNKALDYAKKHNIDILCLGHVHIAIKEKIENVLYVNSGSFCELPSSYILIENGKVELKHVE